MPVPRVTHGSTHRRVTKTRMQCQTCKKKDSAGHADPEPRHGHSEGTGGSTGGWGGRAASGPSRSSRHRVRVSPDPQAEAPTHSPSWSRGLSKPKGLEDWTKTTRKTEFRVSGRVPAPNSGARRMAQCPPFFIPWGWSTLHTSLATKMEVPVDIPYPLAVHSLKFRFNNQHMAL
jgi:hypothetical protein